MHCRRQNQIRAFFSLLKHGKCDKKICQIIDSIARIACMNLYKLMYHLVAVNLTLHGRDVLQLDVVSNGILSCLPYVGMFAMTSMAKGTFTNYRTK